MWFKLRIIIFACTLIEINGRTSVQSSDYPESGVTESGPDFPTTPPSLAAYPAEISADEDDSVLLKLNELLNGIEVLKKSIQKPGEKTEYCLNLPSKTSNSSSFFVPLLKEFDVWLKSNNSSTNKLNAVLLEVVTDEHENLIQEAKRIQAKIDLNDFEDNKANMLMLKALSRNISAEKSDFISRLDTFEKQLDATYKKIGCSGKTVSVVNGKFCRNGKWFFPVGAYIGSLDALASTNFRFTRLRLFGQMWNLKNAGGNVAVFRLNEAAMDQDTIKHLNDIIEIAESIEVLVLIEVHSMDTISESISSKLEHLSESPALFGFNVKEGSAKDFSKTLDSFSDIRQKRPLVLFSASFKCRDDYSTIYSCVKGCDSDQDCITRCDVTSLDHNYNYNFDYHQPQSIRCDYTAAERYKINIDLSLDFVIAIEINSDVAIKSLAEILSTPVVFQGLEPGSSVDASSAIGFFLDDEPIDESKSIARIRTVKSRISSIGYERSTIN